MPDIYLRRKLRVVGRRAREARMFARAMRFPAWPVLAQLVVTRRCNLSCAYCNEHDDKSPPVRAEALLRRVERLAELGSSVVTLTGGEPLLHPELERVVKGIRQRRMLAGVLSNGYLLTRQRIQGLNRAGLDYFQISIDNVTVGESSEKSLNRLREKINWLREHAEFAVSVNLVIGAQGPRPDEALAVYQELRSMGLSVTIGLLHEPGGQLKPLGEAYRAVYEKIAASQQYGFASFARYRQFQENLIRGHPNQWHCPAGGRYLYVCEEGKVHYCSQQRGRPGIPLEEYGPKELERFGGEVKPCAAYCTISCVHQVAMLDELRTNPEQALVRFFGTSSWPTGVRVLRKLFLSKDAQGRSRAWSKLAVWAALRILRADR